MKGFRNYFNKSSGGWGTGGNENKMKIRRRDEMVQNVQKLFEQEHEQCIKKMSNKKMCA